MKERIVVDEARFGELMHNLLEALLRSGLESNTAIVGIHRRGAVIAKRLHEMIKGKSGQELPLGSLDITLYRDDLRTIGPQPVLHRTDLPFDVNDKRILLVDDVIYTGRTVRAALAALLDYGRPAKVELVVLVDRGHRELPIQPDHVALLLQTKPEEFVEVMVREIDGKDGVRIITR